jgi:hypothetical protein
MRRETIWRQLVFKATASAQTFFAGKLCSLQAEALETSA